MALRPALSHGLVADAVVSLLMWEDYGVYRKSSFQTPPRSLAGVLRMCLPLPTESKSKYSSLQPAAVRRGGLRHRRADLWLLFGNRP